MMRRLALIAVLASLTLPVANASAQAGARSGIGTAWHAEKRPAHHRHPYLTIARAEAAMKPAVVESCRRLSRAAVHCTVSEYITEGAWEGWTAHYAERATLARGRVTVTSSLISGS
jgi:hypothetical protein